MSYVIAGLVAGFLILALITLSHFGLFRFFTRQPQEKRGHAEWEDKGAVPLAENKYTPQGMTWVNGRIIFANSWKNTRSRVYEFDPETMLSERHFDMPDGAVHTSGLAWDGEHLWGVDYISNLAYCFDLESSLTDKAPKEIGRFRTTLKGTSACCFVPWNGQTYLAISDFIRTKRTILVRHQVALQKGSAEGCVVFSYRNEGFSQGLEFAENYLYESENKRGNDVINKIDLDLLRQTKDSRSATIKQFMAPNGGVEDLAWDGEFLWTSDEVSFRFYRGRLE